MHARRVIIGSFTVALVVAMSAPGPALAQPLEQRLVPSRPDRSSAAPEIVDRQVRPAQPPVPHRPGFIEGLSKETPNGRMGVAGWTAPDSPNGARGTADPERSGVFGGGFAAEWK
jgi:hypothetical protein